MVGDEATVGGCDAPVLGVDRVAARPHFMQIQRFGMRLPLVIPEHLVV